MTTKKSKRWWPKEGEVYWAIDQHGIVTDFCQYFGDDKISFFLGVYPTRRAAETALRKIKKFVKEEL